MADLTTLEKTEQATILPQEQVRQAAILIGGEFKKILSSWEEYEKPRLINSEDTKEFQRSQGKNGEGLWEVEQEGGYSKYHLSRGVRKDNERFGEEWELTIQPGGIGTYQDSSISAWRIMNRADQEVEKDLPSNNTRQSIDLALKFIQQINGGVLPPSLSQLASYSK